MQSLKSPYTLYNQQSVGSTLHNNLLFITDTTFLVGYGTDIHGFYSPHKYVFIVLHVHGIL